MLCCFNIEGYLSILICAIEIDEFVKLSCLISYDVAFNTGSIE